MALMFLNAEKAFNLSIDKGRVIAICECQYKGTDCRLIAR